MKSRFYEIVHWAHEKYLLNVPSLHLMQMPLVSVLDIPYFAFLGPQRWLSSVDMVRQFRSNLTVTVTNWTSLSEIYPRPIILLYYYILLLWARYCGIVDTVLAQPDYCIIGELFIRYNCEIDRLVDCQQGHSKLLENPWFAKADEKTQSLATEFFQALRCANLSPATERKVIHLFRSFRQNFLRILQQTANQSVVPSTLEQVLNDKSGIAGDLWGIWTQILGYLYAVTPDISEKAFAIFHAFGMAIQVLDDLSDLPKDFGDKQANFLYALVQEYPEEKKILEEYLKQGLKHYVGAYWAQNHLPKTYASSLALIEDYLTIVDRVDSDRRVASDIRNCVYSIKRIQ